MNAMDQLARLWASLLSLGPKRLAALGLIGASVFAVTGLGGYYLSRPSFEILYAGLDRQDVNAIGAVLREADIRYDVNAEGNTVLVQYGQTSQARMLLAERGLPHGANAGNELYDKLGSLGLTSFMQGVTRVRALEGELARTIQTMRGVKAARVHIAMPDEGSFRRTRQPPTASVVVRMESADDSVAAKAIRHLVAAAVPGMTIEEVTVLNSDGNLLSSGDDQSEVAPGRMLALEKTVSSEIQDNIRKTLTPYLGVKNFQISVAARLNTDSRQTNETIYNPESRVERSVRVVKQNQTSQNSSAQSPTTVTQNVPQAKSQAEDGKQSNEENKKQEETTNYELSSKTITTVSGGYALENLSIAVLINRASLIASLGDKAAPDAVDKQLSELEKLVSTAAGLRKDRGDSIKLTAVDFIEAGHDLEPAAGPGIVEILAHQTGTAVSALTIIGVAVMLMYFGLRPMMKALLQEPEMIQTISPELLAAENFGGDGSDENREMSELTSEPDAGMIEDFGNRPKNPSQQRLEQMVQLDEGHAAAILKQWMREPEQA
jgi:flagellar M-ring protein FliF